MSRDKTDAENFMELQKAVVAATRKAIEENAVDLPVAMLAQYMHSIGGFFHEEGYGTSGPKHEYPFRLRVQSTIRPNIESASKVRVVEQVLGWG